MRWFPSVLVLLTAACSSLGSPVGTAGPPPAPAQTVPQRITAPPTQPAESPTPSVPTPTLLSATSLPDPTGFRWTLVVGGLDRPVDLQHASDGRVYIVEQRGVIWVMEGGQRRALPFLDIQGQVNDWGDEQGLLGLAFDPDFQANGRFYVNYTAFGDDTQISRFSVSEDPFRADAGSESVLLRIGQPYANHNGGALAFGPDGYLYIGTGDGGSSGDPLGNAQRLDSLLGKVLRIDVDAEFYSIPADNPFLEGSRPEVWLYGLRNPWRFSFDRLTGDLYIGDVGQSSWEEITFIPAGSPGGQNLGWNLWEGSHPYAGTAAEGLTFPVVDYVHSVGCSVTGGVVVRSPSLPDWRGVYLYGDYCTGTVWGLTRDAHGEWQHGVLFQTGFRISSFGQDAAGEVYVLDHQGGLYRLERTP
jgi:glucose/arabinose dehydrogenase